jgi:hypothetical protein
MYIPGKTAGPAIAGLLFLGSCATLSSENIIDLTDPNAPLTERTVVNGLKQALRIGTERASSSLSARGGFSDNPLVRIAIPEDLRGVAAALRTIGMTEQVDSFETLMNRAAETAAGEAIDVFAEAILSMTIEDAFGILNGPNDAATTYFHERTSVALEERFRPIVNDVMQRVGLYRQYQDVLRLYNALPFAQPVTLDMTEYITDEALEGLFTVLAQEERRIREDPVARTTELLQRVFGRRN